MSDLEPKAKRQRHEDRVTLDEESLRQVDRWIAQVTSATKGVALSRKDVVNWLVKQHTEELTTDELNELKGKYFNEVRFLQQAIKELRAAKQRGEAVTLEEILGTASHATAPAPKRRRARRKSSAGEGEALAPDVLAESHMVNVLE